MSPEQMHQQSVTPGEALPRQLLQHWRQLVLLHWWSRYFVTGMQSQRRPPWQRWWLPGNSSMCRLSDMSNLCCRFYRSQFGSWSWLVPCSKQRGTDRTPTTCPPFAAPILRRDTTGASYYSILQHGSRVPYSEGLGLRGSRAHSASTNYSDCLGMWSQCWRWGLAIRWCSR
jgi:hypothetical protein